MMSYPRWRPWRRVWSIRPLIGSLHDSPCCCTNFVAIMVRSPAFLGPAPECMQWYCPCVHSLENCQCVSCSKTMSNDCIESHCWKWSQVVWVILPQFHENTFSRPFLIEDGGAWLAVVGNDGVVVAGLWDLAPLINFPLYHLYPCVEILWRALR